MSEKPAWRLDAGDISVDTEDQRAYLRCNNPRRPVYSSHPRGFEGYCEIKLAPPHLRVLEMLMRANGQLVADKELSVEAYGHEKSNVHILVGKIKAKCEEIREESKDWFYRERGRGWALRIPS